VGFVVDKVALGQVFTEYFGFPRQFSFHKLLHMHHHLSSISRVSVANFPSFTQNLMQTRCSILPSIADRTKYEVEKALV
jgi:hypothetical protein